MRNYAKFHLFRFFFHFGGDPAKKGAVAHGLALILRGSRERIENILKVQKSSDSLKEIQTFHKF